MKARKMSVTLRFDERPAMPASLNSTDLWVNAQMVWGNGCQTQLFPEFDISEGDTLVLNIPSGFLTGEVARVWTEDEGGYPSVIVELGNATWDGRFGGLDSGLSGVCQFSPDWRTGEVIESSTMDEGQMIPLSTYMAISELCHNYSYMAKSRAMRRVIEALQLDEPARVFWGPHPQIIRPHDSEYESDTAPYFEGHAAEAWGAIMAIKHEYAQQAEGPEGNLMGWPTDFKAFIQADGVWMEETCNGMMLFAIREHMDDAIEAAERAWNAGHMPSRGMPESHILKSPTGMIVGLWADKEYVDHLLEGPESPYEDDGLDIEDEEWEADLPTIEDFAGRP